MPTPSILAFFQPVARPQAPQDDEQEVPEKHRNSEAADAPERRQRSTRKALATTSDTSEPPTTNDINVDADSGEVHADDGVTGEGISAYERKRMARVAENAAFLARLGMKNAQFELASQAESGIKASGKQQNHRSVAKRKRANFAAASSEGGGSLRRSSRLRKLPAEVDESTLEAAPTIASEEQDNATMLDVFFDDSSVLQYTCQASFTGSDGSVESKPAAPLGRSLVGFEVQDGSVAPPLFDAKLKKIYTVSFSPFAENGLLVTGGHQGHVSVYPGRSMSVDPERGEQEPPLLSFKAHKGWVSSASLAKSSPGGRHNLLLTASNDALVKLWDLNQVAASSSSNVPRTVFQTDKLHSAGIFGMDVLLDSVATCSKDSTVVISQFREDSLPLVHRFADQHAGVVKSVHFSGPNPNQLASGGNDRVLRVFDINTKDRAVVQVRNAHARAINSVQFHPTDGNLLVSAGFDADMHLFDLRRASTPLFSFRGHVADAKQSSAIYHPVFVDNGRGIAAAAGSQCRHISLYNVQDGHTISRGAIPYRPDVLAVDPFTDRLLVVSGGSIESYRFKWR